jgi:hypothetical protein
MCRESSDQKGGHASPDHPQFITAISQSEGDEDAMRSSWTLLTEREGGSIFFLYHRRRNKKKALRACLPPCS